MRAPKSEPAVLTNSCDELRTVDPQDVSAVIQALGAAADEIERLEKELAAVTKDRDDLQEKYNELVLSK